MKKSMLAVFALSMMLSITASASPLLRTTNPLAYCLKRAMNASSRKSVMNS